MEPWIYSILLYFMLWHYFFDLGQWLDKPCCNSHTGFQCLVLIRLPVGMLGSRGQSVTVVTEL